MVTGIRQGGCLLFPVLGFPCSAVMLQESVDVVPEGLKALLRVFYPLLLGKVLGQVQLSQELLQRSQVFFTLRRSQVRGGAEKWGERSGRWAGLQSVVALGGGKAPRTLPPQLHPECDRSGDGLGPEAS